MTLPSMTLQEMRLAAQERADMVLDDSVSDANRNVTVAEWNRYLNGSLFNLYDKLVEAFGADYYATETSFTTDGTSDTYALASDFYKLLGVDVVVSTGADGRVSLRPFSFTERNRAGSLTGQVATGRFSELRYRLRANSLWLTPRAAAGQTIAYQYVPRMSPLVDIATLTFDPQTWGREDTSGALLVTGQIQFDGYTGADEYIDLGLVAGLTANQAATQLAAQIVAMFGATGSVSALGVGATASGNVITLTVPSGSRAVSVVSTSTDVVASADAIRDGTTSFDGFSGWLDWVVLDAARKALVKQEQETTSIERELAELDDRIKRSSAQRDPGAPATVADVYADEW